MARGLQARSGRLTTVAVVSMLTTSLVVAGILISSRGAAVPPMSVVASGGAPSPETPLRSLIAGVPQRGIVLGRDDAPVTMVEFADLQCPACRQYAFSVLPTLIRRFVAPGRLRIVWRNLAFIGPDSLRAARMAQAAGFQNRLWSFIDVFFYNAGHENTGYATDSFLRGISRAVPGLDVSRALADRASPSAMDEINESAALARGNRVQDTPSFLLGPTGGRLSTLDPDSVTDPGDFAPAIDRLLRS